jgi:NAD-specific glutamate dehydrogenase
MKFKIIATAASAIAVGALAAAGSASAGGVMHDDAPEDNNGVTVDDINVLNDITIEDVLNDADVANGVANNVLYDSLDNVELFD